MPRDAQAWDERYRQASPWAGAEPAEFLLQAFPLLPRGAALDVASGAGRNALFLAGHGYQVIALERSRVALQKCEAAARERGITTHWASQLIPKIRHAGVALVETDLESFALPASQFDLILCFKYLQRSLLPFLERALRPRGVLIYETYTLAHRQFPGSGPSNPEFLLRPDELRETFSKMEILFYSEICAGKGIASLLARKA